MSNPTVRARAGQDRANLYNEITDKIIVELEAGRVPWVQPWGTAAAKAPLAIPKNASTDRSYSGINVLLLWGSTIEHGYSGQSWLTFRQALSLGGYVRKGERGTAVVYAGITFRIGGDRAFYEPAEDFVQVPPPQAYFEPINWHRTALHELGHATGHRSRLNRDLSGSYGTKKYAFEELVAELSSAFSCASLGIVPTVRHADYIGSWLEVLREDNRAIVRAA
jgi:antirestriction protein ArdC